MKNALIVLDIDHTLIDTLNIPSGRILMEQKKILRKPNLIDKYSNNAIWERPHLKEFLQFLSKNFKYIGIWTNGTDYWLKLIVKKIITKYVPRNQIIVMYSINRSIPYNISRNIGAYQYNQTIHLKKLETIWNNLPKRFNIDEKNTLLIDDNYDNCVYNRSNSLPARKFTILKETPNQNSKDDRFLKNIMFILSELKNSQNFNKTLDKVYGNIRNFDKLFI
jgi:FMN phosphatase YigB (HAD superfamily)